MITGASKPHPGQIRSSAWLIVGAGLVLGTVDLLFAYGFWRSAGTTLIGILHAIGAGVYGKQSAELGATSAAVGLACHYFIAVSMVAICVFLWRRIGAFSRHWIAAGLAYGLGLYLAMNFVIVPLSAAPPPRFTNLAWVGSSILMHMLFGLWCSWTARTLRPRTSIS